MHGLARNMLLLLGLLHLPAAFAGDTPKNDAQAAALDSLLLSSQNPSFAGLSQRDTLLTMGPSIESTIEFKFQDSSALGRIRRLRSLSLLTLAETKKSRLFLGMNNRGLFGLHFGYTSRNEGDRSLEFARMPYLKSAAPAESSQD